MKRGQVHAKRANSYRLNNSPHTDPESATAKSGYELYYNEIGLKGLIELAQAGGLYQCVDLKKINHIIKDSKVILEVMAGYGRTIEYVARHNPQATITAIERDPMCCSHMRKKFGTSLNIIQSDVLNITLSPQYDLVLWLWSGICEFKPYHQKQLIEKLFNGLSNNGQLIIDVMRVKPMNAYYSDKLQDLNITPAENNQHVDALRITCHIKDKIKNAKHHIQFEAPSHHAIVSALNHMGIAYTLNVLPYKTDTDRPRQLYVITKQTTQPS